MTDTTSPFHHTDGEGRATDTTGPFHHTDGEGRATDTTGPFHHTGAERRATDETSPFHHTWGERREADETRPLCYTGPGEREGRLLPVSSVTLGPREGRPMPVPCNTTGERAISPWYQPSMYRDWDYDDVSDLGSSYSRPPSSLEPGLLVSTQSSKIFTYMMVNYRNFTLQNLRELVMTVNSQTQSMLFSITLTLHQMSSEITALKEQLRRPEVQLKRKKVIYSYQGYISTVFCSVSYISLWY